SKHDGQQAAEEHVLEQYYPLITLAVGVATVIGMIMVLRINAFIALITAAIVVSLMAPGKTGEKISRVAEGFGTAAGNIGIVIALAAVIGECMMASGAADRIVQFFIRVLGEKRAPWALMLSGFVLAVPVFFDTVFYLLVPLARSMHKRTGRHYLFYILAIGAGGAITHTLVPPTPGPLVMADNLNVDVGWMIMIGLLVAAPSACVGLIGARLMDNWMQTPMRAIGSEPEPQPLDDSELPSLFWSLAPVVLPVLMISTNTVLTTIADAEHAALLRPADFTDFAAWRAVVREQLATDAESPGKRIVETLGDASAGNAEARQELVGLLTRTTPLDEAEQERLIAGLNRYLLPSKGFHRGGSEPAFLGLMPNSVARGLIGKDRLRMKKVDAERMNRALLESAYPDFIQPHTWETPARRWADLSSTIGNANFALLISTVIAMLTLVRQRKLSKNELAHVVETSLMSGGVIILITAGGGAFGAMLTEAKVGEAIKGLFSIESGNNAGIMFLLLGFLIATVLKVAQGSSTVAMITGSAMLAGIASADLLGFSPVYLGTAIGAGSLVGSWMNDSGFWIFAKMGGLTEVEALKSWSILLAVLGVASLLFSIILSQVLPLV
ncbi:MAG: hypothetical protein KDA38_09635, partial [Planctomycetales bacterium]|nr:hypothetical protein [Planctomycetales bacterium]